MVVAPPVFEFSRKSPFRQSYKVPDALIELIRGNSTKATEILFVVSAEIGVNINPAFELNELGQHADESISEMIQSGVSPIG